MVALLEMVIRLSMLKLKQQNERKVFPAACQMCQIFKQEECQRNAERRQRTERSSGMERIPLVWIMYFAFCMAGFIF